MVVTPSIVASTKPIVIYGDDRHMDDGDEWLVSEYEEPHIPHPEDDGMDDGPDPLMEPPSDLREIGAYTYAQARDLCATRKWLWVVDDLFPTRSINVISSEPKAGKSTLIRSLLLGVTTGERFLGRVCMEGPAVYYSLEDQMELTVEMLDRNLQGTDTKHPLYLMESFKSCNDILLHMRMMNKAVRPVLFVVDTLQRGILLPDLNDYATVTRALDAFIEFVITEAPQSTIVFVHHNHKTKENEKGSTSANRIAGSVAIHGSVFTAMVMDVDDETGARYIGTSQRRGVPMRKIPLMLDPATLRVLVNGACPPADPKQPSPNPNPSARDEILACLRTLGKDAAIPLSVVSERTGRSAMVVRTVSRRLHEDGLILLTGTGRPGDPLTARMNPRARK